jgi:hypothetical protein
VSGSVQFMGGIVVCPEQAGGIQYDKRTLVNGKPFHSTRQLLCPHVLHFVDLTLKMGFFTSKKMQSWIRIC